MIIQVGEMEHIVREAAKLLFDRNAAAKIQMKGVSDFVTEVDFRVQQFMKEQLEKAYPDVQFMSEEKDNMEIDFERSIWVLDPVDGTTNLIHDYRQSAISLALLEKGETVCGMIYQPYTQEMFFAEKGKGAYVNGERIYVSEVNSMGEALISIGTSPYYPKLAEENFSIFYEILKDSQDIRRSGSAAIDLALVACGRIDAYFEQRLKLWDYAAGILLVKEAGGQISDYQGHAVTHELVEDIVAGNPKIHELMLKRYLK